MSNRNTAMQIINAAKGELDKKTNPGASKDAATQAAILMALTALGGSRVQEDALKFEGSAFVLPEMYAGRLKEAAKFLLDHEEEQNTEQEFSRNFPYQPYDVANALQLTLKELFGTTGVGQSIQTMFGPIPPEFVTVNTGVGQTTQVPWNRIKFDPLQGHIDMTAQRSGSGWAGRVVVTAPRRYRSAAEGLFLAIEHKLKTDSIYRGKAIISGRFDQIEFLDLSRVKKDDVVYGDEVMSHLEANLWVPIRHAQKLRDAGQPVRRTVLLEGPFGTGKSLAGYLTAQEAVAEGWTFIFVKPGNDLNEAMQTAKLYAPAVVFFEDIDVLQTSDPDSVSRLLDSFDGIGGKGQEIIGVLTTNYRDKIHPGMLRPGRLDALIHIAELDAGGVEKLIKASIPNNLLVNIDYAEVFKACDGYLPAFVREVASRAYRYAMARTGGTVDALFTEDFVASADGLRDQFELMQGAKGAPKAPKLDQALKEAVADVLEGVTLLDADGDEVGEGSASYKPWHARVNRHTMNQG